MLPLHFEAKKYSNEKKYEESNQISLSVVINILKRSKSLLEKK